MCNFYYGIIVKDSMKNGHDVHVVNIGSDTKGIDTEKLCQFRTRWDCKFDWEPDPFEIERDRLLGVTNRRHGPIPVVSFILKAEKEIKDVKEPGVISKKRLEKIFPAGTVVIELQRTKDDSSISFFDDSYYSIQKTLAAINS